MNVIRFAVPFLVALAYAPLPASAASVLDPQLSSFAVLGSSTVTNTGSTILTGNLGVSSGSAITGFYGTVENDGPGVFSGTAHQADATAGTAQTQLGLAIASLGLLGTGITLTDSDLSGLTLTPGVYTVHAGVSNLTSLYGALTLDGQGNANAAWVFQMDSTLITSPGSVVNLINTGSGAGVYWDVRSSATLDTTTSFLGNILALTSITLNTGATMSCGGAYAHTGAVTMDSNSIGTGCVGGLDVAELGGTPTFLPFASIAAIPEPETYAMMLAGLGLLGFAARRRKMNLAA